MRSTNLLTYLLGWYMLKARLVRHITRDFSHRRRKLLGRPSHS